MDPSHHADQALPLLHSSRSARRSQLLRSLLAAIIAAVLLALAAISASRLLPSSATEPQVASADAVTLLVLGDWGREAKHGQPAVADSLAAFAHREQQLSRRVVVLSTGDNFYKSGVSSPLDVQFNSSFENVYHHHALQTVPWYVALGNHDHLGSIHAQIRYSQLSTRWFMPAAFYSTQLSANLVAIVLDTTPFVGAHYGRVARELNHQSPQQQLAWLSRTLSNLPPNSFFMLVGHHNMYSMSIADHLGTPEVRDAIEPILKPYRSRMLAYVSGHEHSLMHLQPAARGGPADGPIEHVVSGAGSKLHRIETAPRAHEHHWRRCCDILPLRERPTRFGRTVWGLAAHGFFALRFDGRTLQMDAVDVQGNSMYSYHRVVA